MAESGSQRFLYLILDLVSAVVLTLKMKLIDSTSGNCSPVLFQR